MIPICRVKIMVHVILALMLLSCAVPKREGEQYVPENLYDLSITYGHEEKAFLFKVTSHADDEICIPKMSWPDKNGGHYFFEDRRIYFVDHDIRYDIKNLASGYCTPQRNNGCIYILTKNEELFGKLPIEDFVVPSEIYLSEDFNPQLQYPYAPRFCAIK